MDLVNVLLIHFKGLKTIHTFLLNKKCGLLFLYLSSTPNSLPHLKCGILGLCTVSVHTHARTPTPLAPRQGPKAPSTC